MGDGGFGDGGGMSADVTEGAALVGGSGLGTAGLGPGFGVGVGAADVGGYDTGFGAPAGPTGLGGQEVVTPTVATASTKVEESPKVVEQKEGTKRKARRRSLLDEEEGGLTPTNIYRRSILGS